MASPWTEEQFALAVKMLERGASDAAIRAATGKGKVAAEARLYRINHGARPRIYVKGGKDPFSDTRERFAVPDQAIIEARLRNAARDARSLTASLMGDPPPGYSELDRRRSA